MMSNECWAAKLEISEVLARYCRGVDRLDEALTLACFTSDASLRYADVFAGTPAEFVRWLWPIHRAMTGHTHRISNVLVDLPSPTTAVSESYVFVTLRLQENTGQVDVLNHGRYLDRWRLDGGVWRIHARAYVGALRNSVAVAGIDMSGRIAADSAGGALVPTRDADDPSYAYSSFMTAEADLSRAT